MFFNNSLTLATSGFPSPLPLLQRGEGKISGRGKTRPFIAKVRIGAHILKNKGETAMNEQNKNMVVVPVSILTPEWLEKRRGIFAELDRQLIQGVTNPGNGLTLEQL